MTVTRLRRITAISALAGVLLLLPYALVPERDTSTASGLYLVATFAGICTLVLAANGLAWSAIFPHLPKQDPHRFTVTGIIVGTLCLLSIAAVIALSATAITTYSIWHSH